MLIADSNFRNLLVVCLWIDRCNSEYVYYMTYPSNLQWVSQLHNDAEALSVLDTAKACFAHTFV